MITSILAAMVLIATNDPDAFDMQNLKDQGTYEYMCLAGDGASYSIELDKLCAEYIKAGGK